MDPYVLNISALPLSSLCGLAPGQLGIQRTKWPRHRHAEGGKNFTSVALGVPLSHQKQNQNKQRCNLPCVNFSLNHCLFPRSKPDKHVPLRKKHRPHATASNGWFEIVAGTRQLYSFLGFHTVVVQNLAPVKLDVFNWLINIDTKNGHHLQ